MTDTAKAGFGVRHVQCVLIFFSFLIVNVYRFTMSMAIVSMTNKNSSNPDFQELDWNEKEKSMVLSGFYCGSLAAPVLAGVLAQQLSPKLLLAAAMTASSLLSLAIPLGSNFGWGLIFIFRIGQGICEGFLYPLAYKLASKWCPEKERSRFLGFTMCGSIIAFILSMPISGFLASSSIGWPSIFYVPPSMGLVWLFFWSRWGSDTPEDSRNISVEEKEYIRKELSTSSIDVKVLKTPWRCIFTSLPALALFACHLGTGWGSGVITTRLPSYLTSFLDFDITWNGIFSGLPSLGLLILMFPVCIAADYIKDKQLLSDTTSRKVWTTLGLLGPGAFLLIMTLVGRNPPAAIILLIISVSLNACVTPGFYINHLDLSPNFASVLMGVGRSLENLMAVLGSLSVGWIITDMTSQEHWTRLAYIVFASFVISDCVYILFGSANKQSWDSDRSTEVPLVVRTP